MRNEDGFTLMEVMVVLSIIILIMAAFPLLKPAHRSLLTTECERLHTFLLQAQSNAITQQQEIAVYFQEQGVTAGKERFSYDHMQCVGTSYHYTAQGTISKGQSIVCKAQGEQRTLVLQLGSGAIDMR